MGSRELRPQLGLFGQLPKEFGEPWRKQDGVAAQDQVGVLVTELEVSWPRFRGVPEARLMVLARRRTTSSASTT